MSGKDLHRMRKESNKQINPDNLSGVNGVFKDMSGEKALAGNIDPVLARDEEIVLFVCR